MDIGYQLVDRIKLTCIIHEHSNEILDMLQFCKDDGYTIIRQGCPIDPSTGLPDITQYVIIAELEF